MQYSSVAKEITKRPIPMPKKVIVRRVVIRKSILQRLIPYLQVIGFIIYVCLANGIVENL
ncbi:MAG: hypothetical protein PHX14_10280 [Syntrophomonadaceae bacterium]|nr:hypothetical protein [Syntrophomonadaceae bacterium]